MKLSELSVRRGVTFSMLFILVIGFGLFSLSRLRLDLYPDVTFPMIGIITTYEGVGPVEMETMITRPIEEAAMSVKGVKEVLSTSKQGASVVFASFEWGYNLDKAEEDIRRRIDMVEGYLPPDARRPLTIAFDPSMQPVVFLAVSGPYDQARLRMISEEEIEPLMERVPGIAAADTMGGLRREIQVRVDPHRLESMGVALPQLVAALRSGNMDVPGGIIEEGSREYNVRILGVFQDLEEIERVVVGTRGVAPVRVQDVAQVVDSYREATRVVRNDGRDAVMIAVRKQADANTVGAGRALLASLPDIESRLPEGVRLQVLFNQEEFISRSIGNLRNTALMGFGVTFLVLLLFLRRFRPSLIVATAIPVSVVATFAVMDQAGLTLNILSMAGLALAIGLLVDNAIVVQENIFRHIEDGVPVMDASILGASEVGVAITASTLTTMAVFVPVLFVPGIAGVLFKDMAITICFSLATSLLVAISLIPLLASRLLKSKGRPVMNPEREMGEYRTGDPAEGSLGGLARVYQSWLKHALNHKLVVVLGVLAALGLAVFVVADGKLPVEFFPKEDQSQVRLQLDTGVGTNIEAAAKIIEQVEEVVRTKVPETRTFTVDMGRGEGMQAIFSEGSHAGNLRIRLTPPQERQRSQEEIQNDLKEHLEAIPGLRVNVGGGMNLGGGSGHDMEIEIYGHDLEAARRTGLDLVSKVGALDNVVDVKFSMEVPRPELELVLDREKMGVMGLNPGAIGTAVSTAILGTPATRFRDGGDEFDVQVRFDRAARTDRDAIGRVPVITPVGMVVPVANLTELRPAVGPQSIARKDQRRLVTLSVTVAGRDLGGTVAEATQILDAYPFPEGFSYRMGGTAEDLQQSLRYLALALLVAVVLVYMVMASQFESLKSPFIIIFTVPMAFIGVVVALFLTNTPLSVNALIGVVMLVGIAVNNGIVLVDYTNQLRQRGMGVADAVLTSARTRLRPVLMTATTTSCAMIPLALGLGEGAEGWAPMARAIIGGLFSATILTLVLIPVLYVLIEGRSERRQKRLT